MNKVIALLGSNDVSAEHITFGLSVDRDGQTVQEVFSMPVRFVEPLIGNLLAMLESVQQLRAASPMYAGVQSGLVLSLAGASIAATQDGRQVLVLDVQNSSGQEMQYRVAASAEQLRILGSHLLNTTPQQGPRAN